MKTPTGDTNTSLQRIERDNGSINNTGNRGMLNIIINRVDHKSN